MTTGTADTVATPEPAAPRPRPEPGSRPFIARVLKLKSHHAQQVLEFDFKSTAADLFTLTYMTRVRERHDLADEAEALMAALLQEYLAGIREAIAAADREIAAFALQDIEIEYTRAQAMTVQVTTPHANQYLSLVLLLDELMYRLDVLHITGVIDTRTKFERTIDWKRKLRRLTRALHARTSEVNELLRAAQSVMTIPEHAPAESTTSPSLSASDIPEPSLTEYSVRLDKRSHHEA